MKDINVREVIRLIETTNLGNRAIERLTGVSRTTVANYRKRLRKIGLDWPAIEAMNDNEIDLMIRKKRQQEKDKRPIDTAYYITQIEEDKNVTMDSQWQEYCLIDPDTAYSKSTFYHVMRRYKRKLDLSMRQTHRAGEKVFVDFAGTTIPYTNPKTGEVHQAQIFVATHGCSNYTFACAVKSQSIPCWIEAHNRMLFFLAAYPSKSILIT